jgi:hypothetical protein
VPRNKSAAAKLYDEYSKLSDSDQEEFDRMYVVDRGKDVCQITAADLQSMLAQMRRKELEKHVAWCLGLAAPEFANQIETAISSYTGPKAAMSERDAWILAQRAQGKQPGEILQELRRRGHWLTNAKGLPLKIGAIRSVIKRERRANRQEE